MSRGPLERSLRRATAAFAGLMVATFAVVLPQVAYKTEDAVFQRQTAHMLAVLQANPAAPLAPGMRVLGAGDPLPRALRERIAALPPGIHELNDVDLDAAESASPAAATAETDLFVGIAATGAGRLELVYDVRPFEAFDEAIAAPEYDAVILAGVALAIGGGLLLVRHLRRVFASLRTLAPLLRHDAPTNAHELAAPYGDDEIGELARELVSSRNQLAEALDRERRFTREASHELRTPVAVVAGAVELLRRDGRLAPVAEALVERIAGANNRIEALIQAFLWLAREPRRAEELQTMTLQPLLQRVLLDLRRAGGDADDVQLHVGADLPFEGEPLCAEIVLRNLVDNALRHRGDGPVAIHVDGELRIVNTLPDGPTPAGSSHGLGLGIARDLCRRFGWRLLVTQQDGRHTAAVRFAAAGD
jgi:signal transduction histidine kinase